MISLPSLILILMSLSEMYSMLIMSFAFLVSAIPRIEILRWFMNSTISGSLLVKPQTFQVPIRHRPFSSPGCFQF